MSPRDAPADPEHGLFIEVRDGKALAMQHMLDVALLLQLHSVSSKQPNPPQCDPAGTRRVGRAVCAPSQQPLSLRAPSLLLGTPCSTEVLLELSELHHCTGHYREKCREMSDVSCLRTKARERYHADGQHAEARCHPRHMSQGMHYTGGR